MMETFDLGTDHREFYILRLETDISMFVSNSCVCVCVTHSLKREVFLQQINKHIDRKKTLELPKAKTPSSLG